MERTESRAILDLQLISQHKEREAGEERIGLDDWMTNLFSDRLTIECLHYLSGKLAIDKDEFDQALLFLGKS